MKLCRILAGLIAIGLLSSTLRADEKRFTYTYEPELLPQGGMEFEQWVTLRTQRTAGGEVQQDNYNLWEIREELEYGVTDNYSLSLYLNFAQESFRDLSQHPAVNHSSFDFDGVSIENRYMALNLPIESHPGRQYPFATAALLLFCHRFIPDSQMLIKEIVRTNDAAPNTAGTE